MAFSSKTRRVLAVRPAPPRRSLPGAPCGRLWVSELHEARINNINLLVGLGRVNEVMGKL
jgi:hypothetical protein